MKNFFLILMALLTVGCGTDVKPTAFIDILADPSDADELSLCLTKEPTLDNKTVGLTLDKQCLIDFSNRDVTDPNLASSFASILANPEAYLDRILTFEAVIKKHSVARYVELYTNNVNQRFFIYTDGAVLYSLSADGEKVEIIPNSKYRFTCRIEKLEKNIDRGNHWVITAEFIVSESKTQKEILHPPVPVK